jgi:hypothetical protein
LRCATIAEEPDLMTWLNRYAPGRSRAQSIAREISAVSGTETPANKREHWIELSGQLQSFHLSSAFGVTFKTGPGRKRNHGLRYVLPHRNKSSIPADFWPAMNASRSALI